MHEAEKLSLEQIEAFLNASETIRFEGEPPKQIYSWIEQVLCRQEYHQQSRPVKANIGQLRFTHWTFSRTMPLAWAGVIFRRLSWP